jgi:hypothetical protein
MATPFSYKTEARDIVGDYWGRDATIRAEVRYNDECKNGHNTFTVTADIRSQLKLIGGGCCHDEVMASFPELEPLIKWHLTSDDGPMHYVANTCHHAKEYVFGTDQFCKDVSPEDRAKAAQFAMDSAVWPELAGHIVGWRNKADYAGGPLINKDQVAEKLTAMLEARLPQLLNEFSAAVEVARNLEGKVNGRAD